MTLARSMGCSGALHAPPSAPNSTGWGYPSTAGPASGCCRRSWYRKPANDGRGRVATAILAAPRRPGDRMLRFVPYVASILLAALCALLGLLVNAGWFWAAAVFTLPAVLSTFDLLKARSTLRRNYPVLAHFRYGLESIGPEMRQYFIQSDTAEVPFSRLQRALVYQRSKSVNDTRPFGTLSDVYCNDYEWINHSLVPAPLSDPDYRVLVGENTAQPYSASVFNISAMSFGSLSANAIRALNKGAKMGGFYH